MESFHYLNTEYLNKNDLDDKELEKSNEQASYLVKKAELEIKNLTNIFFNGNILKFKRNNGKINENILGITIGEKIIDSIILSNYSQIKKLLSLCEFSIDQKWNLIYIWFYLEYLNKGYEKN